MLSDINISNINPLYHIHQKYVLYKHGKRIMKAPYYQLLTGSGSDDTQAGLD